MKKFWNWKNSLAEENEPAERILELYGTIASESWFDDDITPQIFKEKLFSGTGDIVLYISSPGGDCIAASQIYTMLMDYPGNVTVKIDGIAASAAASVIAMAGIRVLMAPTGMLMIHNPSTMACGDHNDMQKAIDLLDDVKRNLVLEHDADDSLILAYITAAVDYAESYQHLPEGFYTGRPMPPTTRLAVILLASHFYESRDGSTGGFFGDNVPAGQAAMQTADTLLRLNREWKV